MKIGSGRELPRLIGKRPLFAVLAESCKQLAHEPASPGIRDMSFVARPVVGARDVP